MKMLSLFLRKFRRLRYKHGAGRSKNICAIGKLIFTAACKSANFVLKMINFADIIGL